MTETLERPDVVQHDLQHLDFEISCDIRSCDHHADWWNVCLACGAHTPVCELHRRKQVVSAESAGPFEVVLCPHCHVAVRGRSWRQLFSFVPIGRT